MSDQTLILAAAAAAGIGILRAGSRTGSLAGSAGAVILAGIVLIRHAWTIRFVPLTSPFEAFSALALALCLVFLRAGGGLERTGRTIVLGSASGFFAGAAFFPSAPRFPGPLLNTVWYALHVPLTFLAYAWLITAAGGAADALRARRPLPPRVIIALRRGFVYFSLAMILGGFWGIVSWGAWFLWDAKILWSLALWLYAAVLLHLPAVPRRAARVGLVLVLLLPLWVVITFVGTSFFSGSIHRF